jgi:hypothetical protein
MPISIPRRVEMSSTGRFLCVLLAVGLLARAWGSGAEGAGKEAWGWESFVKASSRSDDPVIIELVSKYDLQTALSVLKAVGERDDPYAGDILDAVAAGRGTRPDGQREYLLRILVESLFDAGLSPATLSSRAEANRGSLDTLVRGLNGLEDPQLQSDLVRVMEPLGAGAYASVVADALAESINGMQANAGNLSPMRTELLLSLLSYVSRHPSPDFLELSVSVARLSRDERAVEISRSISRAIAASMR